MSAPLAAPRGVLDLQRSAGNFAVQGLLASNDRRVEHRLPAVPPSVAPVLARGGRPLDPGIRAELEPLVGADLRPVRVHDDVAAAQSAEEAGANAYSAGEDIVFGPGRFAPQTGEGRALLAHEVGHVVASRNVGGAQAPIMRDPKDGVRERARLLGDALSPRVTQIASGTVATIYFAHDTFLIERDGFAVVEKLGEQLSYMAKPMVTVDGHASMEGPDARNEMLGRMRREAVIAILASKARNVTFGGGGHGASDPAVPETASDPREREAQRAQNRRVTIVITDLSRPGAAPTPPTGEPGKVGKGGITWTPHEETPEEAFKRRLEESLKLPIDLTPPKHSFSEQFWKAVDDTLDSTMSKIGVPKEYRGKLKDAAHSAIETGAEKVLDAALDAAHLPSTEKEAIKAAVKQAAQTKF